ncbi:hypothetical protein PPERSA_03782 [Pseudocohnilembus persalinus]|uniref:legumain n=1 Tax=Pseudocohnilembus persalinus TaxID=266149 RepID=A0A0V0R8B3_PSEPJ|nr:hypothetical protein PPERSA_03782 [Pseudocohnilembus persalinus]|eukprot:KRX10724.1 hypothetical protein PPERSA_03782 [Pseudocohnilembus persalinus]
MKNFQNFLLVLVNISMFLLSFIKADNFAFLAAGSKGYINYRHQADVCHAYQILIKNGFKEENIIVMAYDDVANNWQNPYKGTLYNKPSRPDRPDENVYEGCNIDYWGRAVHPKNFLNILSGDGENLKYKEYSNQRVFKTNESDNIFVFFSDHGGPGLISFPPQLFVSKMLFKRQLVKTLKKMKKQKKYDNLTFYMETCYSGSMFTTLPDDIGVYALSAANATQPSLATFCPPRDNYINGKKLNTCLGDVFSINWMENTENSDIFETTLQQQFEVVKEKTTQSHVLQWGDLQFTNNTLSEFMAPQKKEYEKQQQTIKSISNDNYSVYNKVLDYWKNLQLQFKKGQQIIKSQNRNLRYANQYQYQQEDGEYQQISNYKIETDYLVRQYQMNPIEDNYLLLQYELLKKKVFKQEFDQFKQKYQISEVQLISDDTDFKCYEKLIKKFEKQCFLLNEYAMSRIILFYNFCAKGEKKELLEKVKNFQFCHQGNGMEIEIEMIKEIQDLLVKKKLIE